MPNFSTDYPQDVDSLYKFLTDPEAIRKRCEALGEKNIKVDITEAGGTTTLTITREIESDLPSFAKKLFSSTNTIVERAEWRDAGDKKTCKSHIDVLGTPGKIDSDITLSPTAGGSNYDMQFEVSAKVPLIRKKLEEFVAKTTLEGIQDQHAYNKKALSEIV